MKPLTAEWIAKAEGDFALMEREGRVRTLPPLQAGGPAIAATSFMSRSD